MSDFNSYVSDAKTKSAVERQLGIIGEAANKLEKQTKLQLKNAPKIIGLRNRIIHAYDYIDDAIIWTIIKEYIPTLKSEVHSLLIEE